MSIVSARQLSKSFGPQTLFDDIALTVRSGERIGLLGANGTGKSTLLRILAGLDMPDRGTVERRRGARILYLSQEPVVDATLTPRQTVEEGLTEWHAAMKRHEEITRAIESSERTDHGALVDEQAALTDRILQLGGFARDHVALEMLGHLGVRDIDRPLGTMSGGERRRVALARLLVSGPDLAILDEPTNHLDTDTIEWLEEYLADTFGGAVLMVTHDRYVLDAIADRVLELDGGSLTEFSGGYADYLEQKAELILQAERVEQSRLNLMRRERAWLLRGAKARTTKQKARVKRAEALLEHEAPRAAVTTSFAGLDAGVQRTGKTILDLEEVSVVVGTKQLVNSLTLRMISGERVGVIGPNGAGKTTLLELVSGKVSPTTGRVVRGQNTSFVYFDQGRSHLRDGWSVFDNVAGREGADGDASDVVRIGPRIFQMRTYLEQFAFEGSKQRQKVGALSGGERARVALAKALRGGENLLLLDEPTNDLDVSTLSALEELLLEWPGCAMVVSHDRYFLDRVATSMLVFEGDGAVTHYPGGYETYRSLRAEAARVAAAAREPLTETTTRTSKQATIPILGPKPLTFAERKELDGLLDEITLLEETVGELERRLGDPTLYAGPADEARRLGDEHERVRATVLAKTARWEDLESRRGLKR